MPPNMHKAANWLGGEDGKEKSSIVPLSQKGLDLPPAFGISAITFASSSFALRRATPIFTLAGHKHFHCNAIR